MHGCWLGVCWHLRGCWLVVDCEVRDHWLGVCWDMWQLAWCLLRHTWQLAWCCCDMHGRWLSGCTLCCVGFCALLTIQAGQNQTLLLFGILFLPRHDKQKNISSGQSTLVHFSSLSLLLATVLQVQIEFIFRASLIKLADCCFDPHQYQVLKIASIPKHDKWNCWMARSDYSTWWYLPQYPVCNTTQHKRVVPHL